VYLTLIIARPKQGNNVCSRDAWLAMIGCIKDMLLLLQVKHLASIEKRGKCILNTFHQIRYKGPDPQPGLVNMPCLPPSPACLVRVTGGRGGGELHIHSEVYVSPTIR